MTRKSVEELLAQLAADVAAAVAALNRVRSPQAQLVSATTLLEGLRAAERVVVGARDQAIVALAQAGASYARLGQLAGLTRGRVSQIVQKRPGSA